MVKQGQGADARGPQQPGGPQHLNTEHASAGSCAGQKSRRPAADVRLRAARNVLKPRRKNTRGYVVRRPRTLRTLCYANNPDTEGQNTVRLRYTKYPEQANPQRKKVGPPVAVRGLGEGEVGTTPV